MTRATKIDSLSGSTGDGVTLGQLSIAIAWNSYFVGGTDSIALPFVAVLPLMTLLIDRARSAVVWLVVGAVLPVRAHAVQVDIGLLAAVLELT